MTDLSISIEGLSDDLMEAYRRSKMNRGAEGRHALEWAFGTNPKPFAVAREHGRIVGISAYIRTQMKLGSETGFGVQAVDSFVDPGMRGRGVFTQLAQAYDAHADQSRAGLVWGFPNDNAAPAWFGKLQWENLGQVPFMVKPLRAGFFLRKLGMPGDFTVSFGRNENLEAVNEIGDWVDGMWDHFSRGVACGTIRDSAFLSHRLINAPQAKGYRVVSDEDPSSGALLATREARKHGGHIAYVMEAMGGPTLRDLLVSELARLRDRGVEIVFAWSFPWSPNYRALRRAGFTPLPERLRPIRIWFGGRPHSAESKSAADVRNWYLSYLDSDTV